MNHVDSLGMGSLDSESKRLFLDSQRRVSEFRAPHSVTLMKLVATRRGQVILFAGGAHLSCTLVNSLMEASAFHQVKKGSLPSSSELLERGEVTCLCAVALPASDYALGVAGTTHGSVVLFIIDGTSISKIKEVPMQSISGGSISITDSIRDVVIGMDPTGRLEFVAVASKSTLVVADIHHFLDEEFGSRFGLRSIPSGGSLYPHLSNTLVSSFTQCTVAKILAPLRHHAAFALDVALVVVLSGGTVRYVERTASGASVAFLQQHQQLRQSSMSSYGYHHKASMNGQIGRSTNPEAEGVEGTDPLMRSANIEYQYDLSPLALETSRPDREDSSSGNVYVNDATLIFNATSGCMDLFLVGSQQQVLPTRLRRGVDSLLSSPVSASGVLGDDMHGTLGSLAALDGNGRDSGAFSPQTAAPAAWWALTEQAVHPQATLEGLAKYKMKFYQGEDHERHMTDYVTSLNAHTISRCERIIPSQLKGRTGLSELNGLGISNVAASSSFLPSSSGECSSVVSVGGDLYTCCMSPVTQKPSPEVRLDSPALRTLPMLQYYGSTGGAIVESVLMDFSSLNADNSTGGKPIVLAASGSTLLMWVC